MPDIGAVYTWHQHKAHRLEEVAVIEGTAGLYFAVRGFYGWLRTPWC